jgi:hypothetical protein
MENTPKTDTEIIELLAREVMGWVADDPTCWKDSFGKIVAGRDGWSVDGVLPWNPLESIADAWMIVEKMADHHKDSFRLHSFGGKESQANFKFGGSSVIGTYTKADTAPRAICLAALSAIRSTDQQKGSGQ